MIERSSTAENCIALQPICSEIATPTAIGDCISTNLDINPANFSLNQCCCRNFVSSGIQNW
ncbi:hypothetical protein Hanom_Chr01g00046691 [Helianthus anomalus]